MNRREAAEYALEALKKKGVQTASVVASEGYVEELNAQAGEFSLYRTLFNSGLDIKAIKDGKKGVTAINSLEKEVIDEAVASCVASAEVGSPDEAEGIAEKTINRKFESGVLTPDKDKLYDRIEEYMADLKEQFPLINLRQFIATFTRNDALYLNSNGVEFENATGYYDYSSMFSGQEGTMSTSFNSYHTSFSDLGTPLLSMGRMRGMLEDTLNSFNTRPVDGKFLGPVILAPGCLNSFLGMMGQRFAGESAIVEGTSIWKDKLGMPVLHPSLTFGLKPLDPRIICGERFTSDGFESVDMDIVKNGVLAAFLLSLYGAKKSGKPRAGNLSRNLVVEPGDKALSEIIGGIEKGLIVNRFSGGNPAGNGDFSGIAKNSFLIQNGRIVGPVSETMISGNLEKIFQNILAISREAECNGSSVLPWIAVDGVTISGAKAQG